MRAGLRAASPTASRSACALLRKLAGGEGAVIALGGGTVTLPEVRGILRRSGDTFWLKAPVAVLASRLTGDTSRRLLAGKEPAIALAELETKRSPMLRLV